MPNSNFTVAKGTPIVVSMLGISMDPEYFPEPEKFMPERFSDEHKNYDDNAYFPFGEGPRHCIGECSKQFKLELLDKANVCIFSIFFNF
jgi:cytochrome P450 family 6